MLEGFIKKKGQLAYKYIVVGRECFIYLIKAHSDSNKYLSDIIKMPMILMNKICVIFSARVS
jgi:hypothetical protein